MLQRQYAFVRGRTSVKSDALNLNLGGSLESRRELDAIASAPAFDVSWCFKHSLCTLTCSHFAQFVVSHYIGLLQRSFSLGEENGRRSNVDIVTERGELTLPCDPFSTNVSTIRVFQCDFTKEMTHSVAERRTTRPTPPPPHPSVVLGTAGEWVISLVKPHWRSRIVEKVRAKWIATQCKHSPPVTIATSLHPSTHRSWMNVKAEQYSERRRMAQNQRKLVNVQNESMKHGKPSKAKLSRLAPFYIPNPHLNWNSNHHPSQPFTPGQRQTVIAAQPWKDRYPAPHRQTEVQLP